MKSALAIETSNSTCECTLQSNRSRTGTKRFNLLRVACLIILLLIVMHFGFILLYYDRRIMALV